MCSLFFVPVIGYPANTEDERIEEMARQFLSFMGTDEGQQAAEASEIARAAALRKDFALAKVCVDSITGWRRFVLSHELASIMAANGAIAEAKDMLESLPYPPDSVPSYSMLQITVARADSLARCGRPTEARKLLDALPPSPEKWKAVSSILHYFDSTDADSFLKQMTESSDAVAPVLRATALIGRAEIHFREGEKEAALRVMDDALSTLGKKFSPMMIDELCRGARLLVEQGELTKALAWARAGKSVVLSISPKASWRAAKLRVCAQTLELVGSPDEARECFRLATEAVVKDDVMGLPESAAAAALVAHERGDTKAIESASMEIMKISSQHPHHRARAMAVLKVIALHVEAGLPFAPQVVEGIDAMAAGIVADPHFRK